MVTHIRHPKVTDPLFRELAALYGVRTSYRGEARKQVNSPDSSVLAVLRSLGAELPVMGDVEAPTSAVLEGAIRARRLQAWRKMVEPVLVAWDGVLSSLAVRLPRGASKTLRLTLVTEDGRIGEWTVAAPDLQLVGAEDFGRDRYEAWKLAAPWRRSRLRYAGAPAVLSAGYHRLRVESGALSADTTVISAPRRCWSEATAGRGAEGVGEWGLFAPLYALRSDRDWGAGDLVELRTLAERTAEWGGSAVATLPLLSAFLDAPFEPSPYRPVSRLFWNEFFLAVDRIPEWERCPAAREAWSTAELRAQLRALRALDLVDYRKVMALKRQALEQLAFCFFEGDDQARKDDFASYLGEHPFVFEYARFRADVEERGVDWQDWPVERTVAGGAGGTAERGLVERYHLYSQWQMEEQLSSLAAGCGPVGLFLDLPVGVHPGGFDTWRWPGLFVHDMSAGAPPDAFFSLGQHWDSPPLDPVRMREDGHSYFAACLRHHMRHAGYLRIDHVMSLHRLFWIPSGASPADGVYVTYPADELYAVLSLESHRNGTVVVGEDLGTVPPEVRPAMRSHGVSRTFVAQASFRVRAADPLAKVPPGAVASINTHDMFPFAGFVNGDDIRVRAETGQVDEAGARREAAARARLVGRLREWAARQPAAAAQAVFGAPGWAVTSARDTQETRLLLQVILLRLVAGTATLTLVNLEDLELETRPQNVPGTGGEWGNWRRKILEGLPQEE